MKTLIFVRHAHRDTSRGRYLNNGLSEKGKKQARKFTKFYLKRFPGIKPLILSSPAKRCVQTVKPLGKKLKLSVRKQNLLVEQGWTHSSETEKMFFQRVRSFLRKIKRNKREVLVVCSHGDWIPLALKEMMGKYRELKKGEWKIVRV